MSDYPICTKLSDLLSDDEDLLSPNSDQINTRVNIDFTPSSTKAIVYRDVLNVERDHLDEDKRTRDNKEDIFEEDRDKLTDKKTGVSTGSTRTSQEKSDQTLLQTSDQTPFQTSSEQPYGIMSKKLGSLFPKGGRSKKENTRVSENNAETVLPHLKSSRRPIPEVESSFIDIGDPTENHFGQETRSESRNRDRARDQPASTAASGRRNRVSPIEKSAVEGKVSVGDNSQADLVKNGKPGTPEDPQTIEDAQMIPSPDAKSSKSSKINGENSSHSNESSATVVKADEDDTAEPDTKQQQRPEMTRSKSEVSNNTTASEMGDSEDEVSEKEQNEPKSDGSDESKKKKSSRTRKKDIVGARATRSSLLRAKSNTSSDSKKSRRSSVSSDDSDRSYKTGPPPPIDPIPDADSDFKPNEHWKARKDAQKAVAKIQAAAKLEFAEKYRKHGLANKRTPSYGNSSNATTKGSSNVVSTSKSDKSASKNILKPELNLVGTPTDKYLTPLQQKEKTIRDLQGYVNKMELTITLQGDEIANFQEEKEEALQFLAAERDIELDEIFQEMKKLEEEKEGFVDHLTQNEKVLENEKETVAMLHDKIAKMEIEREEREEKHRRNYLQMYQKGREAQLIEQEEDLVCHAMVNPGNTPNKQLINRLEKTEKQLDKLRETFRSKTYNQVPHLESDSEAQVELLKSAVFYFLTDCQADINLKTMLSMLNYSEVQKKNIYRHLDKKKKK